MTHIEGLKNAGKRIEELRGEMTQAEFARRLGVDRKSVAGWESGKRLPDGASLLKLVAEFGADVNYILTGQRSADKVPAEDVARTPRERALLDNYRHSSEAHQELIRETSAAFAQSSKGIKKKTG